MTRTNRTVWRTGGTNRDLLEYDQDRGTIVVPCLELNGTELAELRDAVTQLLAILAPGDEPDPRKGALP